MCGRFAQIDAPQQTLNELGGVMHEPLHLGYNIAPGGWAMAYRQGEQGQQMISLRWGLLPAWAKDASLGWRTSQARMESAHLKPTYRHALRRRRCVVPVDGFYEWQGESDNRQPWLIQHQSQQPLFLAGLWENWTDPRGHMVETFALITTPALGEMVQLHHRMPLLLSTEMVAPWLDPQLSEPAQFMERQHRASERYALAIQPVTRRVNQPAFNEPACLQPISLEALRQARGGEQGSLF
ncbi:SOS response-associated peptidase [Magnetococcus sp. PR-3]|uniref:SOS response-associated peptidase n=1 Tax=Magnetococcus sp. PR-3 TaxID=3120355 RepID=UPI002FCE5DC8